MPYLIQALRNSMTHGEALESGIFGFYYNSPLRHLHESLVLRRIVFQISTCFRCIRRSYTDYACWPYSVLEDMPNFKQHKRFCPLAPFSGRVA